MGRRGFGQRFKSLDIGRKLTLVFGALTAFMLLVVSLALVAGRNATRDIDRAESVRGPASLASAQAQASLLRMQTHVRGYLVLSDPADIEHYHLARQSFESSLAALQAMSDSWPEAEAAQWVGELTANYARWVQLPRQLFELHDNPLRNRPALRLARIELQALRVSILDQIDAMISIQKTRGVAPQSRELMADLLGFQTTFDAMVTNLMAYGASGELNFKLAYGPQLATNAAIWNGLAGKRRLLSSGQLGKLDRIARERAGVAELALQIFSILNGERAYEDLYLYRTEVVPQAEVLLGLLGKVTALQQTRLQTDLARARRSLADARRQTVAGGLLAIAFSLAMAFVLRRNIVGPVRRLTEVAEQVAAGDLSARAVVESGDEIGVLAITINTMTRRLAQTIVHLKAAFAEAQRAREAAETANRVKSTFLANMSHELRTPLNAILGYANILKRETSISARQAGGLETIRQSGEHLLTLINDLLDLAKIESGKFELCPEAIDLPAFLTGVADIIRVRADEKNLLFALEAPPDLPAVVLADDRRLRQVLLNLLGNAVKFTDRGEVRLRVQLLPNDGASARLRFAVADTGIGIAPEALETIFQPFEQVGDAKRRDVGTGLGLAISRRLVQLMGGEIGVASQPGIGSCFSFDLSLPLVAVDAAARPARQTIVGYTGARRRVLIADDVAANRAILADLLGSLGFTVVEAADGRQALAEVEAGQPDLVLMDLEMPVMDGLETIRRLRAIPGLEQLAIIAISASIEPEAQRKTEEWSADRFLAKPIDPDRLLAAIGALLKLEWVDAVAPPAAPAGATGLEIPPRAELEALHGLACSGDMRAIRQWASRLQAADARYRPFAEHLENLAGGYQSKAILTLVEAQLAAGSTQ